MSIEHTEAPNGPELSAGRRSPAAIGLTPGLFLALGAALAVLALNNWWLLPALDTDSVVFLEGARSFVTGDAASIPVGSWREDAPGTGLEGRGTLFPWLMSLPSRAGLARPHVGGLWLLAGGLALAALCVSWVAGGAAGTLGGVLGASVVILSPLTVGVGTALRPELPAAAAVALQMGLMIYQPKWNLAHGAAGALAWLLHPVGAGAVAAAVVWPGIHVAGSAPRYAVVRQSLTAALPAGLFLLGGGLPGVPQLPALLGGPGFWTGASALADPLRWAGGVLPGLGGLLIGAAVLVGLGVLVALEAAGSPRVAEDTPWYDPGAPTLLAQRARPAAGLLALGLLIAGGVSRAEGELARPGFLIVVPLAALAAIALARMRRFGSGRPVRWLPWMVGLWIAGSTWGAVSEYRQLRSEGAAHTERKWVASPVIRWLDAQRWGSVRVFASDPHLVYLQTLHPTRTIPSASAELEAFAASFRGEPPGVLVLTEEAAGRAGELGGLLGLQVVVEAPEGIVLFDDS